MADHASDGGASTETPDSNLLAENHNFASRATVTQTLSGLLAAERDPEYTRILVLRCEAERIPAEKNPVPPEAIQALRQHLHNEQVRILETHVANRMRTSSSSGCRVQDGGAA